MSTKFTIRQLLTENPCALVAMNNNEEQVRLMDVLSDLENEFKNLNDDKVWKLFKKFQDAADALAYEEMCRCFENGVKFGVMFGMALAED